MSSIKEIIHTLVRDPELETPYILNRLRWKALIRKNLNEGKEGIWIMNNLMGDPIVKKMKAKLGQKEIQKLIAHLVDETTASNPYNKRLAA